MEITYRREGNSIYAVLPAKETEEKHPYAIQMLLRNQIPFVIPLSVRYIDNDPYLLYQISNRQSLTEFCRVQKLTVDSLKRFVRNLWSLTEKMQDFFLNTETILLIPELIFLTRDREKFEFCIDPYQTKPFLEQLRELLQNMLNWIDYNDQQAVTFLYEIQIMADQGLPTKKELENLEGKIFTPKAEIVRPEQTIPKLKEQEIYQRKSWKTRIKEWVQTKNKKKRISIPKAPESEPVLRQSEPEPEETVLLNTEMRNGSAIELWDAEKKLPVIVFPSSGGIFGKQSGSVTAVIPVPTVSRIHGKLYQEKGVYYVEDLNSMNGTRLNGALLVPYSRAEVHSGDVLQIGGRQFRIMLPIDK